MLNVFCMCALLLFVAFGPMCLYVYGCSLCYVCCLICVILVVIGLLSCLFVLFSRNVVCIARSPTNFVCYCLFGVCLFSVCFVVAWVAVFLCLFAYSLFVVCSVDSLSLCVVVCFWLFFACFLCLDTCRVCAVFVCLDVC